MLYKAKQMGSFCFITYIMKEKPITDHVGEPLDDPVRHPKIWNYTAKRLKTVLLSSCRTLLQLVTALLGHGRLGEAHRIDAAQLWVKPHV